MNRLWRYVTLALPVQLAAACSQEAQAPARSQMQSTNGAAASTAPQPQPQQQDERLVLALGDSLYAGFGLEQDQSFPAVLEKELEARGVPAKVVNAGISGDTTAGGLRRLAYALEGLERKPDLVIVGLGANDVLRGLDPAEIRRNLDAMLQELERRDIKVMLTGMMAPRNMDGPYIRRFEAIYPDLAARYGAQLDPFFLQGVITRGELLLDDGMHPNAEGIRTIAQRLAPKVAETLRSDDS
jgi:acyl-CoA thioesterase-1